MKTSIFWRSFQWLTFASMAFSAAWQLPRAGAATSTNEDFTVVGEAVVQLLNSGDAKKFADQIAPSFADWESVRATNKIVNGEDPVASFKKQSESTRQQVELSAIKALERATKLGVDRERVKYEFKKTESRDVGTTRYPSLQAEGEQFKYVGELTVVLTGTSRDTNSSKLNGDYSLTLGGMFGGLKFPAGWRFSGGLGWRSFPTNAVDQKTAMEMALMEKVARKHKLTLADDPTLGTTGTNLIRFLQTRDEGVLTNELMKSGDELWAGYEKIAASTGRKLPPREEFEKAMGPRRLEMIESARGLLTQLDKVGVNLSGATMRLQDAVADRIYPRGSGSAEDLDCGQISFAMEVVSATNKTPSGQPITGQYIVASGNAARAEKRWTFMSKMRWQAMPDTVLDEKTKAALKFENYVAEHRALPPGTPIPDVEVVAISDGKKLKLPELKKEATIVEFWATWCGPCQEPMAKLQKMWDKHPEWKDRVAIVTTSIDDTADLPRKHMDKRGWTNSIATWVGEGDWQAGATKAFRVTGVPTCYVFDKDGKVAVAGHPESIGYEEVIARMLK